MEKKTIYTLGLAAGLLLSNANGTRPQPYGHHYSIPSLRAQLEQLNEPVNNKYTNLEPGARTTIIFLPEKHDGKSVPRARAIDQAITLDGILLEGISGEITEHDATQLAQNKKRMQNELPAIRKYISEGEQLAKTLRAHPKKEDADLPYAGFLVEQMKAYLDETALHLIDEEISCNIRLGAPGGRHLTSPTRAKKIGMEDAALDQDAKRVANYLFLAPSRDYSRQIKELAKICANIKDDDLFCRLADFVDTTNEYLARYQKALQKIEQELPKQHRDLADTPVLDNPLIVTARSNAWIKNALRREGTYLMIGGVGHSETVFKAAQDQGARIITLRYKE